MLFKEAGYDEFLAKKITQGRAELAAGKGVSLEQLKSELQDTIEQTAKELNELEHELVYA